MAAESDILSLLEEILDSGRSPDDVCKECPHLLPEVKRRWNAFQQIDETVAALLPDPESSSGGSNHVAAPEPDPPPIAGYRIEAELGHGGMGVVYRALHLGLNRPVALKMLLAGAYARPKERERFHREAQAVAALRHPNIIQVYDVGEVNGRPYFTMELFEGGSLAEQIRGVPQPAQKAAQLIATLAEAVEVAHRSGIIHRDLKPSNILLTSDGTPKVTDFGLARRLNGDGDLTLTGTPVGTPSYMSPCQARGDKSAFGPTTDVYALGAVLYDLLTGRPPFQGESTTETLRQVLTDDPVRPARLNPRVPRDLETICLKCLEKEPSRRYSSAGALAEDLRRFLRSEPIVARPVSWAGRAARWARRHPSAAAHVVLFPIGLLLLLALIGERLWKQQQQAAVARAFAIDLDDVARFEATQSWGPARVAAERARGRVAVDGTDEQRAQADRAIAALDLAQKLERVRMDRSALASGNASGQAADREYQDTFRAAGIADQLDPPSEVAARITASGVRRSLVAALDDWASETPDEKRVAWCFEIANSADPDQDDWRRRARDPKVLGDKGAIIDLAKSLPTTSSPTALVVGLSERLARHGGDASDYLKRIQVQHPADFWVNFLLANALMRRGDPKEAIGYYRAAVAARPDAGVASNNLALALKQAGRLEEAIAQFERTIRIAPGFAEAYCNLGVALKAKGKPDEALACFRKSVEIKPTFAGGHNNLGNALRGKGDLAGAAQCYETAARLDPAFAEPHFHLALIADQQERLDDAIRHYQEAVRLNPKLFQARNNLGRRLVRAGRPQEGLDQLLEAVRIAPGDPAVRGSLAMVLGMLGRPDEALEHQYQKHYIKQEYLAAAKLYADAFGAKPSLAENCQAGHRNRAAIAAALVGCGRGADLQGMSPTQRAEWRKRALDWLRAELAACARLFEADPAKHDAARDRLASWRKNPDLSGVREAGELEHLSPDERGAWIQLWRDVEKVLAKF